MELQTPDGINGNQAMPTQAAQARSFLVERFGTDADKVARVGRGEWSKAFTYNHADVDFVIRFSALEEDFAKDRWAIRFANKALPIRRVMEVGPAFGGFYAISERAYGRFLDTMDASEMRAMLPALFTMLDALRLADVSGATGYGGWRKGGAAPHATWADALLDVFNDRPTDRLHGWRERLTASEVGMGPFIQAFKVLEMLAPEIPMERHLIHSDLLNYNVLVDQSQITAVIDWGCAMYGDFLYDAAWFEFWAPWYPAWQRLDFRGEALRHYQSIGIDVPSFDRRLGICAVHIGLDSLAYNAFRGRWAELDVVAKRTVEFSARLTG
jgi:hygromycin-B 4-O-kinase